MLHYIKYSFLNYKHISVEISKYGFYARSLSNNDLLKQSHFNLKIKVMLKLKSLICIQIS